MTAPPSVPPQLISSSAYRVICLYDQGREDTIACVVVLDHLDVVRKILIVTQAWEAVVPEDVLEEFVVPEGHDGDVRTVTC